MNTKHETDDSLSALLDGELSDQTAQQQIRHLGGDPAARARFAEYCTIGDLLRGHQHDVPDLTERVMAALEREPTVLAPRRNPPAQRGRLLWLAAAAVAAITWSLWSVAPRQDMALPLAARTPAGEVTPEVTPYLAAHQDYAQAVATPADLHLTLVAYPGEAP